jgi:hypothetical protein
MVMPLTTLHDVLGLELEEAYVALAHAKAACAGKDTPHHREMVAQCYSQIDCILDLLNESEPRR